MLEIVPKCAVFFSNYSHNIPKKGQFLQTEHAADRLNYPILL